MKFSIKKYLVTSLMAKGLIRLTPEEITKQDVEKFLETESETVAVAIYDVPELQSYAIVEYDAELDGPTDVDMVLELMSIIEHTEECDCDD